MKNAVLTVALVLGLGVAAGSARAQLLAEHVIDQQRLCLYVGSDQQADGQITQRSTVVPTSQACPQVAPFRDPNRQPPGNAALLRETTNASRRQCVYGQGGVEYVRDIALTQQCAMTPDLLTRSLATRASDAPGR